MPKRADRPGSASPPDIGAAFSRVAGLRVSTSSLRSAGQFRAGRACSGFGGDVNRARGYRECERADRSNRVATTINLLPLAVRIRCLCCSSCDQKSAPITQKARRWWPSSWLTLGSDRWGRNDQQDIERGGSDGGVRALGPR